ncbi:MAG: cytochrome c oxidase subunit 3 [Methylobacter sp.]
MTNAPMFKKQLPIGTKSHRALGWWGMLMLIATEAALFAYLLFSYFYLISQSKNFWVPAAASPPLHLALPNTIILLVSSLVLWWGERAMRRGHSQRQLIANGLTLVLGIVFMVIQLMEWHKKTFTISQHAYGSLYFTITGFHMLHVLGGVLILGALFIWTAQGHFNVKRHAPITIGAVYWHFVDAVWLAVFGSFYLYPYLR